jgi:hypothetical protein
MAPRNKEYNRAAAIYEGLDAGVYTLPADLLAHREGIARIRAALVAANEEAFAADPGAVRSRLARLLPNAARKGDLPTGWVADLREAQDTQVRAGTEAAVLDEALGLAENQLVRAVDDLADEVITDHLRPVLEDIIAKIRKATASAGDVPWEMPRLLARAPKNVRDAFAAVEEEAERYSVIRRAQFTLHLVTADVEENAWSLMSEIRNLPLLWPQYASRMPAIAPPWPKDRNARMVWLTRPEVEVWMPTSVDLNDAYTAYARPRQNAPRMAETPVYLPSGR